MDDILREAEMKQLRIYEQTKNKAVLSDCYLMILIEEIAEQRAFSEYINRKSVERIKRGTNHKGQYPTQENLIRFPQTKQAF